MKSRILFLAAFLLAAPPGHAVRLDPEGLGQALIYPYYTMRPINDQKWNLLFSVINTRSKPKVVKVRLRESLHGRIVLEFNLYLGPHDGWGGAVIPTTDGKAGLITSDTSCADPFVPYGTVADLASTSFQGSASDGASTDDSRTFEGYIEMIEMGTLGAATATAMAKDCSAVVGAGKTRVIEAPEGGLMGGGYLINVNTGLSSSYNAVALAELTQASFYSDVGQPGTDFDSPQVLPISIMTVAGTSTTGFGTAPSYLLRSVWNRGVDAVSAVLMTSNVTNEYVLDPGTASDTDWVVTLPTARFYTSGTATAPFTNTFSAKGACETVLTTAYNREQSGPNLIGGCQDQGCPTPLPPTICWAANVIPWTNDSANASLGKTSLIFGSPILPAISFSSISSTYLDGFATTSMSPQYFSTPNGPGLTSLPSSTAIELSTGNVITGAHKFGGLPVVGFSAWSFNDGLLDCGGQTCRGTFGMTTPNHAIQSVTRIGP